MKVKFSKFERVAGMLVLCTFLGFVISIFNIAIKQGWFDKKTHYYTQFETGEGIFPGVSVQISGIKAGAVDFVEFTDDNKIFVKFYVFKKFENKIRKDSVASLIRPFVIGDRVLDITLGSNESEKLAENSKVQSTESIDIITVMSGKKLGNYLNSMIDMMANLKYLAEAFLNQDRTKSLVNMFDKIEPLIGNLNLTTVEMLKLTKNLNKDERMSTVFAEMVTTARQLNKLLPEFSRNAPHFADDITKLVSNLNTLANDFKTITPAITAISPELPRVSKRAVEALDEAVVLMKAMQKSFIVKGNVQEVREEEAKQKNREPAKEILKEPSN